MAIPAVNMTWLGVGPTVTLEILAQAAASGPFAQTLVGTFTQVLDGTLLGGDVNWVDGTAVLPFTPSGIIIYRSGGSGLSTISSVAANTIGTTKFTHAFSAAGTNAQTVTFTAIVFK